MPPLLAVPPPQFQTTSEAQEAPVPFIVNVVPPTWVMYGLLEGALGCRGLSTPLTEREPDVNAPLSPDALKNVCPTASMLLKIASVVVLGPPQPHEQLKFTTLLLASIAFRTSFWFPVGPAS